MKHREHNSFLTPLVVEVMPSGKRFRLYNTFTYRWGSKNIIIPVGFVTDFASIPRVFRWLIEKLGRHNKAAVVHDALYQNVAPGCYNFTRKMVDQCFLAGMADLGVVKWKRTLMYWAVRLFGWASWGKR